MKSYARHDINYLNMIYIIQMLEANKDKGTEELKKICDTYVRANKMNMSDRELVGTVDFMIDIMVDEDGKSSNRELAKHLNNWQAQILGKTHVSPGLSLVKMQEL